MSDTLVALGRIDVDDELEFSQTCHQVLELMEFCHGHLKNEDAGIHPALEERAPSSTHTVAAEHRQHAIDIERIASETKRLLGLPPASRAASALALYHQLSLFIAHNFEHLLVEERKHNALLWAHYTDAELHGIEQRLLASMPPSEMMTGLRWMLPALSPTERAGLMFALQKDAPPAVFQALLDLARKHLDATQWHKLVRALALHHGM